MNPPLTRFSMVPAVVVEAHNEWAVAKRRHLSEESVG